MSIPRSTFNSGFVKLCPPTPSSIFPVLWSFAFERHRIYMRRVSGKPSPWTTDPVLLRYKFTNAYRAADRVSQYLIRLLYSNPNASADTILLRTLLFKVFNRIETWQEVVRRLELPVAREFSYSKWESALDDMRSEGRPLYSGAYIMPSGGRRSIRKHQMHVKLIQQMINDGLADKLSRTKSLSEAYKLLVSYPTIGPFLAFQYVIDLNYSTLLNHREEQFVVAGPGALDGLSKCFDSLGEYSPSDTIQWLFDVQEQEFERYELAFSGLWGRPLQPIDIQNLFCEVSKYTRITHPNVSGQSGRKRIKQRYKPTGPLEDPFFPPKWNINSGVSNYLEESKSYLEDQHPDLRLPLFQSSLNPRMSGDEQEG